MPGRPYSGAGLLYEQTPHSDMPVKSLDGNAAPVDAPAGVDCQQSHRALCTSLTPTSKPWPENGVVMLDYLATASATLATASATLDAASAAGAGASAAAVTTSATLP